MGLRLRFAMLLCLISAAGFSLYGAYSSITRSVPRPIPEDIYAQFFAEDKDALYYLRPSGDYVAVYSSPRVRKPLSVTGIELSELRSTDRALIEKGLPVTDDEALLYLLEDLGS